MRSLTAKLTLASLCTSLVCVALAGVFARYQTGVAFDHYVQDRIISIATQQAADYYAEHDSWNGINTALRGTRRTPPPNASNTSQGSRLPQSDAPRDNAPPNQENASFDGAPPDQPQNGTTPASPRQPPYIVVNDRGLAETSGAGYHMGDIVPANLIVHGAPIVVEGVQVGTIVLANTTVTFDSREQTFLTQINRILFATVLGGMASALILCIILTQFLTRPIRALTHAIHAMQRGTLRQEVRVTSRDELGELVRAFNQMSHDLDRATQVRRQMTADIAHELRTPLSVLMGYIETMRDGVLAPSQERFQTMYVEAGQLQHLVDDLRLLSLADAGELPLDPQPTDPHELLATAVESFVPQAGQQHVALHLEPNATLPSIMVDQKRMLQVLGNLLSNALRYTPAHGTIVVSAHRSGAQVHLEVADTGTGIAPAQLPFVFERLYRADPSRWDEQGSSGLGLAIVKAIVEAHNGQISAASTLGAGTRMTICLPLCAQHSVTKQRRILTGTRRI